MNYSDKLDSRPHPFSDDCCSGIFLRDNQSAQPTVSKHTMQKPTIKPVWMKHCSAVSYDILLQNGQGLLCSIGSSCVSEVCNFKPSNWLRNNAATVFVMSFICKHHNTTVQKYWLINWPNNDYCNCTNRERRTPTGLRQQHSQSTSW